MFVGSSSCDDAVRTSERNNHVISVFSVLVHQADSGHHPCLHAHNGKGKGSLVGCLLPTFVVMTEIIHPSRHARIPGQVQELSGIRTSTGMEASTGMQDTGFYRHAGFYRHTVLYRHTGTPVQNGTPRIVVKNTHIETKPFSLLFLQIHSV